MRTQIVRRWVTGRGGGGGFGVALLTLDGKSANPFCDRFTAIPWALCMGSIRWLVEGGRVADAARGGGKDPTQGLRRIVASCLPADRLSKLERDAYRRRGVESWVGSRDPDRRIPPGDDASTHVHRRRTRAQREMGALG